MNKTQEYEAIFGARSMAFEYACKIEAEKYKKMQEHIKQYHGTDTMDKKPDA